MQELKISAVEVMSANEKWNSHETTTLYFVVDDTLSLAQIKQKIKEFIIEQEYNWMLDKDQRVLIEFHDPIL